MKSIKRIEKILIFAVISACVISVSCFSGTCKTIRSNVLRMHVIANSDSAEDQELKLRVRDAVLKEGKEIFDGSVTAAQAEELLKPAVPRLEKAAQDEIKRSGFDYPVKVIVGEEYFSTRTYENSVTLPAGRYEAVRVIIGEGEGHNWWCVMFPPMCLPAARAEVSIDDVLSEEESKVVKSNPKFEVRFKIVEWIEEFKERFRENSDEEQTTDYFTFSKENY